MLEYSGSECLTLLIVLGGSLVQGLLGIGFGLLAAPLLYLLDPSYVPGPILLLGFLLACCMLLGNHQAPAWRRPMPAILARLPGAAACCSVYYPALGSVCCLALACCSPVTPWPATWTAASTNTARASCCCCFLCWGPVACWGKACGGCWCSATLRARARADTTP